MRRRVLATVLSLAAVCGRQATAQQTGDAPSHAEQERQGDPPPVFIGLRLVEPARRWTRQSAGGVTFTSIQVNVDRDGNNIVGDAANEPSMAVSPVDSDNIVIGWRQFDTVLSNFRQAGWGYTHDHGQTWTFPGVLQSNVFRSDPVVAADAEGNFYYLSLRSSFLCDLFKSVDDGITWSAPMFAFGGDKAWMTIDQTSGPGRGHVYQHWSGYAGCCFPDDFNRSTDGGDSFEPPLTSPTLSMWAGTVAIGPDGTLYRAGGIPNLSGHLLARSVAASDAGFAPVFDLVRPLYLGGNTSTRGINGIGLLGQVWIAADHSEGPTRGNIYVLGTVATSGKNPTDVMFIRSSDAGESWSWPVRVNGDPASGAWHWFAALSVSPSGRIDVTWYDTRSDPGNLLSEVWYAYSYDGGLNWSQSVPVSPPFDPHVGYPAQQKLGDYTHMHSEPGAALLAYAATFNGEQDVYFLRIPQDCNGNGIEDDQDLASGKSPDCNESQVPDECEPGGTKDCNANGGPDLCDIHAGRSADCNRDAVPDDCQTISDCDDNGLLNECEIAAGLQDDCNHNEVPDNCDAADGTDQDLDGNGILDGCELQVPGEFGTIQSALDAALDGQIVLLADGVYTGEGNKDLDFHGKTVTLRSVNGPERCIIDCQRQGRGFLMLGGETRATRIEGLTITGGSGETGGAISCLGGSSPTIRGCVLASNTAVAGGGGVYVGPDSAPVIQDCVFIDNRADRGGGLFLDAALTKVENCLFLGNVAAVLGGGLMCAEESTDIRQCVFSGNSSGGVGGAIFANQSSLRVVNCTIGANTAALQGGGLAILGTSATISNCILWENTGGSRHGESEQIRVLSHAQAEVTYSLIQGLRTLAATGNLSADPLFADLDGPDDSAGTRDDDLRLQAGSPATDSGSNAAVPGDLQTDLTGQPRFVDDPAAKDCPQPGADCGRSPIVDMGAYEVQVRVPIAIVGSAPPSGAVDARQPSAIDGSDAAGWDAVELTFSGDAAGLSAADFDVAVTAGDQPAITRVSAFGHTATLKLDRPIPAGACTTITHLPSRTQVVLGYLPADANADGSSSPLDLLALIDGLNGVQLPPLEIWQCDIDRSGRCQPADILRAVDLLNGAGAYDAWNGAALPGCP